MYKFFISLNFMLPALLPHWLKAEALFLARYVLPTHHANTSMPATPNTPFVINFPTVYSCLNRSQTL